MTKKVPVPLYQKYVVKGVVVQKCYFSLHNSYQFKRKYFYKLTAVELVLFNTIPEELVIVKTIQASMHL